VPTLNLLPCDDANLRAAQRLRAQPGELLLIAHGTPRTVADLDAAQLAARIRESGRWQPGMAVRLDACRAGAGVNPIAAQLARELGCTVWAPTSRVLNLGRWRVGAWHSLDLPFTQRTLALWPGRWRCFRGCRQTASG
jgi:hypothetical protein